MVAQTIAISFLYIVLDPIPYKIKGYRLLLSPLAEYGYN